MLRIPGACEIQRFAKELLSWNRANPGNWPTYLLGSRSTSAIAARIGTNGRRSAEADLKERLERVWPEMKGVRAPVLVIQRSLGKCDYGLTGMISAWD